MIHNHLLDNDGFDNLPATDVCRFQPYNHVDGEWQYNVIAVNCPKYPDQMVEITLEDTVEGWEDTIDHCANILIEMEDYTSGGVAMRRAKYALSVDHDNDGDLDYTTVTHLRPAGASVPTVKSPRLLGTSFTMPAGVADEMCGAPSGDNNNNDDDDSNDGGDNDGGDNDGGDNDGCDANCEIQRELDDWVDSYTDIEIKACYIDTFTMYPSDTSIDWMYVMYVGGCDHYGATVDVEFDYDDWSEVFYSTGALSNLKSDGDNLKIFNLSTDAKDRVGFRVLKSMGEFPYTDVYVGPAKV